MNDTLTPDRPDVTVALLTRNAGTLLERVLHAVREQDTPRRVELLAIDSGSTDGTLALLDQFSARVVTIAGDAFDFGLTRDRAFEEARAPIVVSLSQDAIPAHPRWLEHLVAPLDDPAVAASCGRSIPDPDRGYPQFPWERNGYFYFTHEMKKFAGQYGRGLSNANSAIRRSVWEQVRFGAASIGEDYRFQSKLGADRGGIAFPDDAPVLHHHNYTLTQLYKRCRNEGLGLRELGCEYNEADLLLDLIAPRKYWVWLRELFSGRLTTCAALAFPLVRPAAVYAGSRFGRSYLR
ncbi:MAG: glycosyltransferase family 2 protein [Candidatus Hydrogenedentes bacterium]|nr:glycosyltransferase family 2 protein [Candidatus Hydrogenedentota bacterium]